MIVGDKSKVFVFLQDTSSHVYLVMEYCNGGDLADYLHTKGKDRYIEYKSYALCTIINIKISISYIVKWDNPPPSRPHEYATVYINMYC